MSDSGQQTVGVNQRPVTVLKGVGPQLAEKLARLQVHNLQDLLFHLPLRYQDRTRVTPIAGIQLGQDAVIEGTVSAANIVMGRRRSLVCRLQDGSGSVTLRFFHFSAAQKQGLAAGTRLRCYGEVRRGSSGFELFHPEYQRLDSEHEVAVEEFLTPIYPATEGLHQNRLRALCEQALVLLEKEGGLDEWLPASMLQQHELMSLQEAVILLHRPPPEVSQQQLLDGQHPAQRRLAFEELLAHQLSLLQLRQRVQSLNAYALDGGDPLRQALIAALPFQPTQAQQRVLQEIDQDLARPHPMLRLVQGDVGSGKTLVAALAALKAIAGGHQVALMAPTEILAEQHYQSFRGWFEPLDIEVAWLSGKQGARVRREQLEKISQGSAGLVVGTHALFQDDVVFARLGLVIIDEQHRFGVHQRLALKAKGERSGYQPHQLIMTATPIPRTLAMSAYADLDCSVIDQLPPGRTPVETVVIPEERRPEVINRVRSGCAEGRQAYWVCTLVEESEALQCQAAEASAETLQALLPELRVGLVHGRMKPAEKTQVMQAYSAGEIQLLVATTVIEVGVDVPNASLMIIENPERLGLAQLHQLRGRVGRGATRSYCVLLYRAPLSQMGRERLGIMRESSDGFVIAEKDLELRGPGELLGVRQTGLVQYRIADLQRDAEILESVQDAAKWLHDEGLNDNVQHLILRWMGEREQYAQV
ncbi:ATP-dependent DNA helicase RecG [Aestuariirhabdus sp. Z084]|uniref:ATP-dependent DNA helicase RecG n=1 Tax=Aestuariirhabdus haliotis TaxID=2918751 RepID=UPI00201B353D|nr:ATP-dependent DNA helicase RecG [Aestuariirhabdus haliotis]MCL6414312.1 ATP-dependent DNA helicase RecG [Aestuariirhabdus haliotis]MCL6418244.1 ATP-dependent DNA helicase RecG [Aestuariirhabdus haliotis]